MKRYFVTGTDTGVGKTFVTAALARRAVARGQRVFAFKPIETGIPSTADLATAPVGTGPAGMPAPAPPTDQEILVAAAGGWQAGDLCGVYRFRLPAAPYVAAKVERQTIDLSRIDSVLAQGSADADLVLVEGAGGWRVPVTESVDMGGLAKRLGMPVIVVARAGLGTINHSRLTIEAAERDGCPVAALVLSKRPDESVAFVQSNADEISRQWTGRVLVLEQPQSLDALL
jgi:dethiobiotin synthetase